MDPRDVMRNAECGMRNGRTNVDSAFRIPHSALGFTLVEVLVALTISAVVVLLAHQVFAAVAERGRTLVAARDSLDRAANARRWLKATFLSLEVGTDSAGGFDGRADRVDVAAWERTADGWFDRRRIALGRDGDRLVASMTPGEAVALMDGVTGVA